MSKSNSKTSRIQRNQTIADGLRASSSKASIPVNGKMVKVADIVALLIEGAAAENAVNAPRAEYRVKVKNARAIEDQIQPLLQPIKSYVGSHFGEDSKEFAACGFAPRKIGKVTAEKRAEAVEKMRATREARGTLGSRQKASIHATQPAQSQPASSANSTTDAPAQTSTLSLNGNAR